MRTALTTLAVTSLLAASLSAQGIADRDTNADGVLDEAEFGEALGTSELFERWDTDAEGSVDRAELLQGVYDLWDRDGDGDLSVSEWDDSVDLWYGEDAVNLRVEEWDSDGDGVVGPFEFAEAINDTALFAKIGIDAGEGPLTPEVLETALFDLADADDSAFVAEDEDVWVVDFLELLNAPGDAAETSEVDADTAQNGEMPDLIQDGEAFSTLPLPCGDGDCEAMAARFCTALDYDPPLDFLEVGGSLYVIRCGNSF